MAFGMANQPDNSDLIRQRMQSPDSSALADAFALHRSRLRRMVDIRLDDRIRGRVDPSDVLQEAYIDAAQRIDNYVRNPDMSLFLWLRLIVGERMLKVHRYHLGAQVREAGREVRLYRGSLPAASSAAIAARLLGKNTSPTQAAQRTERMLRLQEALVALDPLDREILTLRHFEELTHAEAAQALSIEPGAAAKRYVRAMNRLKDLLTELMGEADA